MNIADENLTDYSFLSRYYYTKSKNYLKRRYRIRHWIPMFFGTPCMNENADSSQRKSWNEELIVKMIIKLEGNTREMFGHQNKQFNNVIQKLEVITCYISNYIIISFLYKLCLHNKLKSLFLKNKKYSWKTESFSRNAL